MLPVETVMALVVAMNGKVSADSVSLDQPRALAAMRKLAVREILAPESALIEAEEFSAG
jgi:hypothetical protein